VVKNQAIINKFNFNIGFDPKMVVASLHNDKLATQGMKYLKIDNDSMQGKHGTYFKLKLLASDRQRIATKEQFHCDFKVMIDHLGKSKLDI